MEDHGKGIEDVTKAMEPLFTTRPELDRSGMGFSFMTAFMDQVEVSSEPGKGTIVKMKKNNRKRNERYGPHNRFNFRNLTKGMTKQEHRLWRKIQDWSGVS